MFSCETHEHNAMSQLVSGMWGERFLRNLAHKTFQNKLKISTFLVNFCFQKLFREVGELCSLLLCANLLNAIAIAKLILIWPNLTEWSNLQLWQVVADRSRETTDAYSKPCQASGMELFVKIWIKPCLSGFWIYLRIYYRITCNYVLKIPEMPVRSFV